MTDKQIRFGHEARMALAVGVDTLADAVKSTLGPAGRMVVMETDGGQPRGTRDGVSVARAIELPDPAGNAGAQIVRQAASATAEEAGDGTTTTTVLAQALVHEGYKHLAVGADAGRLRQGIEQGAQHALQTLQAMAQPCTDRVELLQLATLAAHGDETLGVLVADALHRVGADGGVQVEAGRSLTSTLHLVEGIRWNSGFVSPRFANHPERALARLDRPLVLLVAGTLDAVLDLRSLMERAVEAERALVVVAQHFAADVLDLLVVNASLRTIQICALEPPATGERGRALLTDLSTVLGTSVFDSQAGDRLEDWAPSALSRLGQADRVDVDAKTAIFLGGRGDASMVAARAAGLRRAALTAGVVSERDHLLERAALLSDAMAVIRIGAATELEYREKVDLADDALRAARSAMREGVVPGGGVAYLRAAQALREVRTVHPEVAAGVAVLQAALRQPFLQIHHNAGREGLPLLAKVERMDTWEGIDAATQRQGDLRDLGIIDATLVVRSALRHAVSAAGMLLSAECVVTHA